jgi:hypothetical protein
MKPSSRNPTAEASRRYFVEFSTAIVVYLAVTGASVWAVRHVTSGPLHYLLAIVPVVPIAVVFVAVLRYLNASDEFTRMVHVEALAISAGVTAMLAVTYGFLESAGFPKLSAWWTYVVVMITWLIANPFVARRYR